MVKVSTIAPRITSTQPVAHMISSRMIICTVTIPSILSGTNLAGASRTQHWIHAKLRHGEYYIGKDTATKETLGTLAPLEKYSPPVSPPFGLQLAGKDLDRTHVPH